MEVSELLQERLSCSKQQKDEVMEWDSYIVWSNDKNQLQSISEFYNICNEMDQAVATWSTNIISARKVWLNFGRPQPSQSNIDLRQNDGVVSKRNFEVRSFFTDNLCLFMFLMQVQFTFLYANFYYIFLMCNSTLNCARFEYFHLTTATVFVYKPSQPMW